MITYATVKWFLFIAPLVILSGGIGASEDLRGLRVPLLCGADTHCRVQNYFDHDPGPDFLDYNCGRLGYDGHNGIDIRVPNLATMRRGVTVVAAASGQVRAARDGMPDVSVRSTGGALVKGREAGNAVVIRHEGGWETQYSHLMKGSVRVQPGERVQVGQELGSVGLSGNTEFPHLHFEVRHLGVPIDPFTGVKRESPCGAGPRALWSDAALQQLRYEETGILQFGFAPLPPDAQAVQEGPEPPSHLQLSVPALVFWVELFGVQAGDLEVIKITDPSGGVLASKSQHVDRSMARWFSYVGRKRRDAEWPSGNYIGTYSLLRSVNGVQVAVISIEQVIEVRRAD
ncbi:MAG TPA: M23 family metallopeptidase [Denitromonas sp.]|nr:M23 family metallopeptidase [Denitromonas sp.]